jgi:hypothetical protein
MLDLFHSSLDAIVDRSPKELIGAVLISLALSLALTGLYTVRRRKTSDRFALMVVLSLGTNVVAMLVVFGYFTHAQNLKVKAVESVSHTRPPGPRGNGLELHLSQRILDMADRDRDGSISSQEATDAAALFVQTATTTNGQSRRLDVSTLAEAMRGTLMPPPGTMGPPPLHPQFGQNAGSRNVRPASIESRQRPQT